MALVFKIKFNDVLRRWLVSEHFNEMTFSLTLSQLEEKIRDLFHLSPTASLVITYVDRENDVVTLGDDQDLVDACLVQGLNPLRLNVFEEESATQEAAPKASFSCSELVNLDVIPEGFVPQVTVDNGKNIVEASTDVLDPQHLTGFLGESTKKRFLAPSVGLGSVIVPPHAPVPPNQRAQIVYHVFHNGVQCDGCGMNPIEGPRYKSTKVLNYDLCFGCYDVMGAEREFEKIEHPLSSLGHSFFPERVAQPPASPTWRPSSTRGTNAWMSECPFSGQTMDFSLWISYPRKFDAIFLKDMTVKDGTELRPGTKFRKIWRMKNNGALPWPQGTQLAHIAGNALSSTEVVNLELPEGGLPCGEHMDVALDFIAPDAAGCYVSHWRLLSPSTQKFGHRVWVVIRVVPQVNGSIRGEDSFVENVGVKHGQDLSEPIAEQGEVSVPSNPNPEEDSLSMKSDVHELSLLPNDMANSHVLDTEIDLELDGFAVVERPVEASQFDRSPTSREVKGTEIEMETQIKDLESLGFSDQDLNLLLLKKNSNSMQGTIADLLLYVGWEEIIRNLKEMGFDDQFTSIRLLHKHKGSIKLVVKDLVKMENQNRAHPI